VGRDEIGNSGNVREEHGTAAKGSSSVLTSFLGMRRVSRATLLSVAALGAGAGTASAEPPVASQWMYDRVATTPLTQGQFYLGITASGGLQQMPRFNGTQRFYNAFAPGVPAVGETVFSSDVLGAQPGGEIGYVFRDGTFPTWMGGRVRAALFGSITIAESSDSKSIQVPGVNPFILYHGINGRALATVGPAGSSFQETLKVEREGFQVGLKLESDIALSPNLSVTPAVAVFGGRVNDSYDHASVIKDFGVVGTDAAPTSLNQQLRTSEIGGHFGARLTWQFQPGWALHVGGTGGPVWMRTRMTATDCLNGITVSPGTPCSPTGGGFFSTSASDRRSTVGFRGTASLGLAVDARIAVISFGGFARYDSRIPGVQNPQAPANLTGAALAPARIRFDDGFAYGGYLTVRIALH
jgi:hypothetical protein